MLGPNGDDPRYRATANSNGQLRITLPQFPCHDQTGRLASVIVLDVGTGLVSNAGRVTAPCAGQ
jgi:hypothetical protein